MSDSKADKMRFESYERAHLKKGQQDLPPEEKIEILQKRDRSRWIFVAVNVLAALFFAYSWYYNITRLSDTLLIILGVVVVINVVLIFYQKKQIRLLIEHLEQQISESSTQS